MKQALEALENTYAYLPRRWGGEVEADQAISALRQAIAEEEKQPVHASDISQERVDETAKRKHEWVGLTDEEIFDVHKQVDSMQYLTFGKAIEAKLKEKNGV
jgi:hypothetical protein